MPKMVSNDPPAKYVVSYSGGIGSFFAAKRVVDAHGPENTVLLFADTMMEDEDLYRFLDDTSKFLRVPITRIADGRTPWEVFRDERMIGSNRADPCSKLLKRELLMRWMQEHAAGPSLNFDQERFKMTPVPSRDVLVIGIDWSEAHRLPRIRERYAGWQVEAPMTEKPWLTKDEMLVTCKAEFGIKVPRLYEMGFPHNNCGGFCVKAGRSQFKLLLEVLPERYAWHEEQERQTIEAIGSPCSVLWDRKTALPMTLKQFRESNEKVGNDEWCGCGCALD